MDTNLAKTSDQVSSTSETFDNFVFEAKVNMIQSYSPGFIAIGIRKTNKDDPIFNGGYDIYYDDTSLVAVWKSNKRDYIASNYGAPLLTQPRTIKIIAGKPFDDGTIEAPKTNISVYIDGTKFIDVTDEKQSVPTGRCFCRLCFRDPLTGRCVNCPCDTGCICGICESCTAETISYPIYSSGYISLGASDAHVHFDNIKITRT